MATKKEAKDEEEASLEAAEEQREMEEEYVELERWKEDNSSYMIGAYLFEKFEEEIKEVSENAKNGDIVVYSPLQNRIYTIPSNADSVSPELVPLKEIKEEE